MAHEHEHHTGGNEYYLQQLITVGVAGAFGVCGVLMYTLHDIKDGESVRKLTHILAEPFHIWVLVGSILLLAVTAFRGAALWMQAGAKDDHLHEDHTGHDHAPGEACNHPGHDHSDHDHSDHDHGNIYWRVIVLAFPIALLVMGLPNRGYSDDRTRALLGNAREIGELNDVSSKGKLGQTLNFDELAQTAYRAETREQYTGFEITIQGKFQALETSSGREFTLFAEKMTCCASDQILLKARGVVAVPSQLDPIRIKGFPMVVVTGKLQFAEDTPGNFIPVLRVAEGGIVLKGKR
jgi:hypothetical protein